MVDKNLHQKPHMEELTWDKAREDVFKVNPELAQIIDKLNPGKEYTLFKARYPYGSEILKKGDFYLPNNDGEIVSLTHSTTPNHIREKLGYNLSSNPVTLVLKNSLELFATLEDRTIPLYGLIPPGKMFGFWRILSPGVSHQPVFIWDMTAGARSLFMLPKISEIERHKKLRKYFHLNNDAPKVLMDHWQIFKEIANHSSFHQSWHLEVLFFPKKWFEHLCEQEGPWINFNYYILKTVWSGSEFWRNQFFWDIIFSIIKKTKNIKISPYIADTIKYLFAIAVSALPGFSPAIDDECAPVSGLQEVYLNIYNLKNYPPVIMGPNLFFMNDVNSRPVYYSLQFPNAVEFGPKSRDRSSLITDLYEVKSLLNKYLVEISSGQFKIDGTPLFDLTKKVSFDYFHDNVGMYHGIKESKEMPFGDSSFVQGKFENKDFPSTTSFARGCIRISRKLS